LTKLTNRIASLMENQRAALLMLIICWYALLFHIPQASYKYKSEMPRESSCMKSIFSLSSDLIQLFPASYQEVELQLALLL